MACFSESWSHDLQANSHDSIWTGERWSPRNPIGLPCQELVQNLAYGSITQFQTVEITLSLYSVAVILCLKKWWGFNYICETMNIDKSDIAWYVLLENNLLSRLTLYITVLLSIYPLVHVPCYCLCLIILPCNHLSLSASSFYVLHLHACYLARFTSSSACPASTLVKARHLLCIAL